VYKDGPELVSILIGRLQKFHMVSNGIQLVSTLVIRLQNFHGDLNGLHPISILTGRLQNFGMKSLQQPGRLFFALC
tara:strand:- start:127 stop:354 length:228 start_codon:yes stop_codon:yes gene_type:complete